MGWCSIITFGSLDGDDDLVFIREPCVDFSTVWDVLGSGHLVLVVCSGSCCRRAALRLFSTGCARSWLGLVFHGLGLAWVFRRAVLYSAECAVFGSGCLVFGGLRWACFSCLFLTGCAGSCWQRALMVGLDTTAGYTVSEGRGTAFCHALSAFRHALLVAVGLVCTVGWRVSLLTRAAFWRPGGGTAMVLRCLRLRFQESVFPLVRVWYMSFALTMRGRSR